MMNIYFRFSRDSKAGLSDAASSACAKKLIEWDFFLRLAPRKHESHFTLDGAAGCKVEGKSAVGKSRPKL